MCRGARKEVASMCMRGVKAVPQIIIHRYLTLSSFVVNLKYTLAPHMSTKNVDPRIHVWWRSKGRYRCFHVGDLGCVYISYLTLSSSSSTQNQKSTLSLLMSAKNDDLPHLCVAALKKDFPAHVSAGERSAP
jgi:hypothetical protein